MGVGKKYGTCRWHMWGRGRNRLSDTASFSPECMCVCLYICAFAYICWLVCSYAPCVRFCNYESLCTKLNAPVRAPRWRVGSWRQSWGFGPLSDDDGHTHHTENAHLAHLNTQCCTCLINHYIYINNQCYTITYGSWNINIFNHYSYWYFKGMKFTCWENW